MCARLSGPAARVRQAACSAGSQYVPCPRVVLDDPSGGHRAQPFPHITLLGAGRCGDVLAGARRQLGHRIEQPDLVPDADHQRDGGAVQNSDHAVGELLGGRRIELGSRSVGSTRRSCRRARATYRLGCRHGVPPLAGPGLALDAPDARSLTRESASGRWCNLDTALRTMMYQSRTRSTSDSVGQCQIWTICWPPARASYARRDWPVTYRSLAAVREHRSLTADDLHAMADAAWWLGLVKETMTISEECHQHFLAEGRPLASRNECPRHRLRLVPAR